MLLEVIHAKSNFLELEEPSMLIPKDAWSDFLDIEPVL